MFALPLILLATAVSAAETKPFHCIISGYLHGDAVAARGGKYEKIAASEPIDADVGTLKANAPDAKEGFCRQPTCRESKDFGVKGLRAQVVSCNECWKGAFHRLKVDYNGVRFTGSIQDSPKGGQVELRPVDAKKPFALGKSKYDWIYVMCNGEKDAGWAF